MSYTLEVRPGSPGYVFATRSDGVLFEVYLQYGAIEPRLEDATERAALLAAARAYQPPPAPETPCNHSRAIADVRADMHKAGFAEDRWSLRGY